MPIKERWAADRGEREREGGRGREREREELLRGERGLGGGMKKVKGKCRAGGGGGECRGGGGGAVSEYICSPSTYEEYGRQRQADRQRNRNILNVLNDIGLIKMKVTNNNFE